MDPSSTSLCSQHSGWTRPTLHLGLHNYSNLISKLCIMLYLSYSLAKLNVFIFHSRQVVEGFDILRRLEEAQTCNERPKYECKVKDCGVLKP